MYKLYIECDELVHDCDEAMYLMEVFDECM